MMCNQKNLKRLTYLPESGNMFVQFRQIEIHEFFIFVFYQDLKIMLEMGFFHVQFLIGSV